MLSRREIEKFYPSSLHRFPRFMMREYLQVKLLELIFASEQFNSLSFLGGTCLRIVHGNQRFSEDLDFDSRNLSTDQFGKLSEYIQTGLEREGYVVEMKTVFKKAWHCYVRFPGLLYEQDLSTLPEEKIVIRIAAESQDFTYQPQPFLLNQFEVFTSIITTPLPILLSQKLYAIMNRPRKQGRDFYDVVFLLGRGVPPDYRYLQAKAKISSQSELKASILAICENMDFPALARDVDPFLFHPGDSKKVRLFEAYFRQVFS